MVYQPPAGARDLLPLDVAQKRWIEDRIQQVFQGWGYHCIITSTLEHLDTLMAGDAIQRSTVIQVLDSDSQALGLRPELTASIARAVVTRMAGALLPLRLYYCANVFRRPQLGSHNRQQEFFQMGVELLGLGGVLADAEVLMLVYDGLESLGLAGDGAGLEAKASVLGATGQCSVLLGEAGLTRSLFSTFPEPLQDKVRFAIAHLDRVGLETLPMEAQLRDRALALMDLRGEPEMVLERLSQMELDGAQTAAVEQLRSLVALLRASRENLSLVLDLSLIRTFDYYTGIVFEVVLSSDTQQVVLGQGGRYDQLLGLYHPQGQSLPGVGFSWQIEQLHQVLLAAGKLQPKTRTSDYLVVAQSRDAQAAALRHAQTLRQAHHVVELDLGGRDRQAIEAYARHRRIPQIAWVEGEGQIQLQAL
jgi:ATP phosphoribosyltransferase regulatory subunit